MPMRDRMYPAIIQQVNSGASDPRRDYYGGILGSLQYISAFNNVGKFTPGTLRLNPVIIYRIIGTGTPATNKPAIKAGVNSYTASGDIASALLMLSGARAFVDGYSAWDSTLCDYSINKAYAKMLEPELDVGVYLAELSECYEMFLKPFSAFQKYVLDFNKMIKGRTSWKWNPLTRKKERYVSRPTKLTDTFDMLSGTWLEWRYGITPLLIQIEEIMKHIDDLSININAKMLRKRGAKKANLKRYTGKISASQGWFTFSGEWNAEVTKKATTSLFYKYNRQLTWQERYGLDASNLAPIIWERLPLSFVADWWYGVGLWLASHKLSDARTVLGCCTSQKSKVIISLDSPNVSLGTTTYGCGGSASLIIERLERRINPALPISVVSNPASLSLQRQLDAITLIWQRLPKFRR